MKLKEQEVIGIACYGAIRCRIVKLGNTWEDENEGVGWYLQSVCEKEKKAMGPRSSVVELFEFLIRAKYLSNGDLPGEMTQHTTGLSPYRSQLSVSVKFINYLFFF